MISLPNGEERKLSNDNTIEQKVEVCNSLLKEFDDYILDSSGSPNVTYFLNGLANYLCWHKNDNTERDRQNGIMSNGKEKEMERKRYHGRYRKDTLFSDLSLSDEIKIFGEVETNA